MFCFVFFKDNRSNNRGLTIAPLIPTLRRWSAVQQVQNSASKEYNDEMYATSTSACLLRQANLSPESEDGDKDIDVDLYQAAVIILAHLDRLASPFIQPLTAVCYPTAGQFYFRN